MRFTCVTLLYCLPLLALAQQAAPQENTYFNIPPALQAAGVKWVNDICKDHRGLTWFATNNGIFRFDGTNVLYARTRIDDSATLPSNTVTSVTEDHEGNIWVGTAQGGAIINPNTLACSRIKDSTGYTPAVKFKFLVDADGNTWGETDAGLYKYNRQKKYLQLVFSSGIQGYYGSAAVISAAEWNKDELVLATLADVVFFDKHSFSFHRIFVDPQRSRTDLSKIYVDGDGELWAATWNAGLFHFNKNTQQFKQVHWQNNIPPAALTVINTLIKVRVNATSFLYAGLQQGLARIQLNADGYTPVTGLQPYYVHKPGTEGSIPYGSITALTADEDGTLWAGINGEAGVASTTLNQSLVYTLPVAHRGTVEEIDSIQYNGKTCFAVCSWHGSTGLVLLDDNLKPVKTFDRVPQGAGPDGVNVSSVGEDNKRRLWVSSWKGITVMDKTLHVQRVLDHNTKGPDTLFKEKNNFLLISNDTVWIASYKQGIDLFTTGFKRLKHYTGANDGLNESLIWKFFRSRNGTIWLVGNALLYRYNAGRDDFSAYYFSRDKAAYSPIDMAERKDGTLLIATAKGLVHLNPATGNYAYITSPLLEKEDNINSVCVDDNDNAWYLTDEHLVHYNFNSRIFTLYGGQDGLDVADGLYLLRFAHKKLLIGQENKIVAFTPPGATRQITAPGLLVTGVFVNDSLINSGLPAGTLNLPYNQNKISIAFACINYNRPEQNIYAYRLKNADTSWAYTRQGNVTYANLAPGNYVFEVKAANYARKWSNVSTFAVAINPPFWQSWWFRLLVLAFIASGTYAVFRWRVSNIRREEKVKTDLNRKMAELEMKALRAQMNPHFVFNSLSSIQESIITGKTEAASKYLSKFSKLIRLILENSGKQFIPVKTEIDLLTLYLELESFRFENFTYTFSIDPGIDANATMMPNMVIQPFVENALKHGLSKKASDKHLKIDIRLEEGRLFAIVEDNGVGRARAAATKSAAHPDHHSMGIHITEERLRLLGQQGEATAAEITDLFDAQGNATGTLVKVNLPAEN